MPIVLRFSTELGSPLSALIRWRTDWHHSHVEFQRTDGWTLGSRFSLIGKIARFWTNHFKWVPNFIYDWLKLDGVQFRPPSFNHGQCLHGKYKVSFATFDGIENAYTWVKNNRVGYKYDTLAIFGIVTARNWHCKDGRFCSDVISEGGEAFDIYFENRMKTAPYELTPRDLEISNILSDCDEPTPVLAT